MTPQRIRLRRAKGWRKPEGAVVVSRPSRWGNPFHVVRVGSAWEVRYSLGPGDDTWIGDVESADEGREAVVERYEFALRSGYLLVTVKDVREHLAGRDLACWCDDRGPCHGDVLLEISNGGAP